MPHGMHSRHRLMLVLIFGFFLSITSHAEDLTEVVPTLTHLGPLSKFTPPANCFSASIWKTSNFYDDVFTSGVFNTRLFTRRYVGCNIDDDTGEVNTCCPPRFDAWGFYAPGACPGGYTTMIGGVNPWIGSVRGTVCCPTIASPSGKTFSANGFATSYINPLSRDPISISCFEWDDDRTTKDTIYQGNWNARAIIVFGQELPDVDFQFAQLTGNGASTQRSTSTPSRSRTSTADETEASPGSTSSSGPRETDSETDTVSSTSSTSDPDATADANNEDNEEGGGGGGRSGLSGGAIAGIVIGVAIPVIAAVAFIAYRLGRRKPDIPSIPVYNDPSKEVGGIAPQRLDGWR